jgi:thioredoxin-related protein
VLAEPIVDGLKKDLAGQLTVLTVNISSEAGETFTRSYGSRLTPTFILLDGRGQEVWRSIGRLDPEQLKAELETL